MNQSSHRIKLLSVLELSFLVLLIVRSFSEAFSGLVIYPWPAAVSPSAVVVLLINAVGLIYLGLLWLRRERVIDRLGSYFLLWALSLAPWVYLAAYQWGIPGLTGAREWVRLLSLVLIYLVIFSVARRRGSERVINTCLLALPIPLAATYYQIFVTPPGERAFGVMVHPNNLAAFLVVMIALTVWKLARSSEGALRRWILWGGLLVLEFFALIAPISSNGWLMVGVFLITFALLTRGWRFKTAGVAAGAAFIAIFILIFSQNPRIQSEVLQNFVALGYEIPQRSLGGGNLEGRLQMWSGLLKVWQQQPLQGYGLNTTNFVNPRVGLAAHNDFMRYLVEGGVFGLLLFVLFQAAVGWELFRLRKGARDSNSQLLAGISFGLFLAWVIGSIGDNLISHTVFHVYFWALLASASASTVTPPDFTSMKRGGAS